MFIGQCSSLSSWSFPTIDHELLKLMASFVSHLSPAGYVRSFTMMMRMTKRVVTAALQ
jgi:hypothetical protein